MKNKHHTFILDAPDFRRENHLDEVFMSMRDVIYLVERLNWDEPKNPVDYLITLLERHKNAFNRYSNDPNYSVPTGYYDAFTCQIIDLRNVMREYSNNVYQSKKKMQYNHNSIPTFDDIFPPKPISLSVGEFEFDSEKVYVIIERSLEFSSWKGLTDFLVKESSESSADNTKRSFYALNWTTDNDPPDFLPSCCIWA